MEGEVDIEKYRVSSGAKMPERRRKTGHQCANRQPGAFICGPILLEMLDRVLNLPGRSPLVLFLALSYQSGLERSCTFRLTPKLVERFKISPRTCHDALRRLEGAGLIRVSRPRGQIRVVELLMRSSQDSAQVPPSMEGPP